MPDSSLLVRSRVSGGKALTRSFGRINGEQPDRLTRKKLGTFAEGIASGYLEQHGYQVLQRNVHLRYGEIDVVALKDGVAIFVEVRARRQGDLGSALASLSRLKQHRMRLTAELYLAQHPELPQEGRIDLVAVSLSRNGLVMSIDLIENAVEGHA